MKVAAVVVTYNRLPLLQECLEAVRNQTYRADEIIVVNNGSTDDTHAWLEQQNDLTVIHQQNMGGAGGFYTGMESAYQKGFDWVWMMDDDAEPRSDSLEKLSHFFSRAGVSALASLKVSPAGEVQTEHVGFFLLSKFSGTSTRPITAREFTGKHAVEIDCSSFVGIAVHRAAMTEVGFPKKVFFLHWDDVEYCIRLRSAGTILLVPDSIVEHKESLSTNLTEKKGILGGTSLRSDYSSFWMRYYGRRNSVWVARQYHKHYVHFLCRKLIELARAIAAVIYYNDDHKWRRIVLMATAVVAGHRGKFDNDVPKRVLYGTYLGFWRRNSSAAKQ